MSSTTLHGNRRSPSTHSRILGGMPVLFQQRRYTERRQAWRVLRSPTRKWRRPHRPVVTLFVTSHVITGRA